MGRLFSWRLIGLVPLIASCQFIVPDLAELDAGGPPDDLVGLDLAGLDLAAPPADLSMNGTKDGSGPADLSTPPDMLSPVAVQAVQTGTCAITDLTAGSAMCPLPLPGVAVPGQSVLVFQATSAGTTSDTALVRCLLTSTDLIVCDRVGLTGGTVNIRWQVATFSRGVRVQHIAPLCTLMATTTAVPINAVNPSETFLLFSSSRSGTNIGNDDFRTAELADATTVNITGAVACAATTNLGLQVVEVAGAHVTRGTTGPIAVGAVSAMASTVTPFVPGRTLLLYSWSTSAGGAEMCERMLRGELISANTVIFHRGDNNTTTCTAEAIDKIAYELVELPVGFKVQQVTTAIPDTMGMATAPLNPAVDPTHTLVLAGGQWSTGQGIGEGSLDNMQLFGAMVADHQLASNTSLQLVRAVTMGSARFTSYVVEVP